MARVAVRLGGSRALAVAVLTELPCISCGQPPGPQKTDASATATASGDGGGVDVRPADTAAVDGGKCYSALAYPDNDGDGRSSGGEGVPIAYCGARGAPPPGYTWTAARPMLADCDDTDPNVYLLLYPDQDGDGYGLPTTTRCGTTADEGYAPAMCGEDCDDRDPTRHPNAVETFADGFDADCDGEDNPQDCLDASWLSWLGEPELPIVSPSRTSCVDRPDIAVAGLRYCEAGCTEQTYVEIANLGSVPYQGAASLHLFDVTDLGETSPPAPREHENLGQTLALSLAPGEVSQPILLGFIPGGDTLLSIEPVPGDCDPVNDEVTFYAPFIDCI